MARTGNKVKKSKLSRKTTADEAKKAKLGKKPKVKKIAAAAPVAAADDDDDVPALVVVAEQKPRKKRRLHPGTKSLRSIRKLQKSVAFMLPGAPFRRLMRELCQMHKPDMWFQKTAMHALQEGGESFMHELFRDTVTLMAHRNAVTVDPRDFRTAVYLSDLHAGPGQAGRDLVRTLAELPVSKKRAK